MFRHVIADVKYEKENKTIKDEVQTSIVKSLNLPLLDSGTQALINAILALGPIHSKLSPTTPVKLYGLASPGVPFYLSEASAREILSIDKNGKDLCKKNRAGGSSVHSIENVYFKKCPSYMDGPELFLTEQAVYQMSLLLGGGIITPTRLLVVEFPGKEKVMVQASLAVEGETLGDILSLPGLINGLGQCFEREQFYQELPLLMKVEYYVEWLFKMGGSDDIGLDKQLDLLTYEIYCLSPEDRPKELTHEKDKIKLKNIIKDLARSVEILYVVAFISKYPKIIKNLRFADLLRIPRLLQVLARLYPHTKVEAIPKEVSGLLRLFNPDNVAKHFLLALLVNPSDHHNGSNLKVRIHRNKENRISSLEIIGIDNDRALKGTFIVRESPTEGLKYEILSKTYLFGVKEFLKQRCSLTVALTILSQKPQTMVSRWLGIVTAYAENYVGLELYYGNKKENLYRHLYANVPKELLQRLTQIQTALKGFYTLQEILFELEPAFGRYCEELRIQYGGDPERFVLGLAYGPALLSVLSGRLQKEFSNGNILKKAIEQLLPANNYNAYPQCTYLQSYKQFIQSCNLYTLHFAARHCPLAIESLIRDGIKIEEKNAMGQTALDVSIREKNINSIRILLSFGAGQYLKIEKARLFIQNFSNYKDLCQILLSQQIELGWVLALESISQDNENTENVCLQGLGPTRYLKSEFYQKIFELVNKKPIFRKKNIFGRHNVVDVLCEIVPGVSVGIHFKEKPELLGREIMVHHLARHLFGIITPCIAPLRFICQEGFWNEPIAYPIMASYSIEGNTLKEAIDHYPHQLLNLDKQSVSEAIVLALLINPEDGKADQYILQPIIKGNKTFYKLISIDNDHAFVLPLDVDKYGFEIEGSNSLKLKTILFCLDEMREPLHAKVRERLLAIKPEEILEDWLKKLELEQKKVDELFNQTQRKKLTEKNIYLNIEFRPGIVVDLYEKLVIIQNKLRKYPHCTPEKLFRRTHPSLSVRYLEVFDKYITPNERFDKLTEGCFNKKPVVAPQFNLYLWPKSKIELNELTDEIQNNAIVLTRDEQTGVIEVYFIRNRQWVTVGNPPKLKVALLGVFDLSKLKFDTNGLVIQDDKSNHEIENLVKEAKAKITSSKQHQTQTTSSNIIALTVDNIVRYLSRSPPTRG